MKPRPIIIDTDTGVDDALALMLAFRSPELRVLGITTVAGNVEVHRCTRNVREVVGTERPPMPPRIIAGASRPLRLPLVTAPEVHGAGGMGKWTPAKAPYVRGSARDAARFIVEAARQFGRELTIVAIGPLTNIATAVRLDSQAMRSIGRMISMGGAFDVPGNTGPVAEFNYYVDPHAARIVLDAGLPLTILPLDATEQVILLWNELSTLKGPTGHRLRRLTRGYMDYHLLTEGFRGAFLHDPMAIAEAAIPGLLRTTRQGVGISTSDGPARGMTSWRSIRPIDVAIGVDHRRFMKLVRQRMLR